MDKKSTLLLVASWILSALTATTALAQNQQAKGIPANPRPKMGIPSALAPQTVAPALSAQSARKAPIPGRDVTFVVNVQSRFAKVGLWEVDLQSAIKADNFRLQGVSADDGNMFASFGAVRYDGTFYCMTGEEYYGLFLINLLEYRQANNWALYRNVDPDNRNPGYAGDMVTLNPVSKRAYGTYCDEGGQYDFELCEVDYTRLTRKKLATAQHRYVAMAIDRAGRWFGINGLGDLYEISTTDGTETFIGSTGLKVSSYDGAGFYFQSACFDPYDDTFYWASTDLEGRSAIYTVDTKTAEAELVATLPDYTLVAYMDVAEHRPVAGAPAAVGQLAANFTAGATAGTVAFTLPTAAYTGAALSGQLDYEVQVDGATVVRGSGTPGSQVSEALTLSEGHHRIDVVAANGTGRGAMATVTHFVGRDTPVVADGGVAFQTSGTQATVSWTAAVGEFGGYPGDDVTYTVTRYPDGKVVARDVAATTIADELPTAVPHRYSYGVTATAHGVTGRESVSRTQVGGAALGVPYYIYAQLNQKDDMFTIIDANGDGVSWETGISRANIRYSCVSQLTSGSTMQPADDWLVTPAISLKAGQRYKLMYTLLANAQYTNPGSMEIWLARQLDVKAFTQQVQPRLDYLGTDDLYKTHELTFTVDADGDYYLGFYACGVARANVLQLQTIALEEDNGNDTPAEVSGLKLTPAASGNYAATVTFKAPTTTKGGAQLSQLSSIQVQRDNVVIATIANPTPGQEYTVTDDQLSADDNGTHRYLVVASNASGQGEAATAQVYVGVDIPSVDGMTGSVTERGNAIHITWTPVSTVGEYDGYVDPSQVDYYVYDATHTRLSTLGQVTGATEFDYQLDPNVGEQRLLSFGIGAGNVAGFSSGMTKIGSLVVGEPYALPFREAFADGQLNADHFYWTEGETEPEIAQTDDFDGNGYCYRWAGTAVGSYYSINTGKIAFRGASSPTLAFAYSFLGADGSVTAIVQTPDGREREVGTVRAADSMGQWKVAKFDLSDFVDQDYVFVKVRMQSDRLVHMILVDDINVFDMYRHNLTATLQAPTAAEAGIAAGVSVEVCNMGDRDLSDYTVRLYEDGALVYSQTVDQPLSTLQRYVVATGYKPSVFKAGSKVTLRAELLQDRDDDEDDNVDEADLTVVANDVPKPENVAAAASGSGASLTWLAPSQLERPLTESFEGEQFTDFATGGITSRIHSGTLGGGWTLFGGFGVPEAFDIDYENRKARSAWVVFNTAVAPGSGITPHSGDKFLASFDITGTSCDNWLISPEMSGQAQTISFYATEPAGSEKHETFQVLASKTDNNVGDGTDGDTGSFTLLQTFNTTGNGWDYFTVSLPAGTKYFAILNVSRAMARILCIDDITYTNVFGTITGYNVYADGELVATVPSATLAYALAQSTASEYAVTALFDGGQESMPVVVTSPTGIVDAKAAADSAAPVYNLHGQRVSRPQRSGVYVVGGKKVQLK